MPIRAVIFDFDGLILETETPQLEAWAALYRLCGRAFPREKFVRDIGRPTLSFDPWEEVLEDEKLNGKRTELEQELAIIRQNLISRQPVMPGVREYLEAARAAGYRIGLASSSNHDWVDPQLERHGLSPYFEQVCCRDDVPRGKPWPDLYLAVLEAWKLSGLQALALEDSYNGVLAARRAGMWAVAVPNEATRGHALDHADLRVPSLAHQPLEDLIARLEQLPADERPGYAETVH